MKHRAGLTLVEVLVAIFIMGIGLLAIMTLFPLGLMNYAQAMQDDRAAQAASNGSAIASAMDLRHDTTVVNLAFTNNPTAPGVYVDPWYSSLAGAGFLGSVIPRVGMPTNWPGPYTQWFGLTDDFEFTDDGFPDGAGAGSPIIKSSGYYTWAYLLRRPRPGDSYFTDMSIVVYKGRVTAFQDGEKAMTATGTAGGTTVTVSGVPAIRKTGWIIDPYTAQFYRVISVTQSTGVYVLETQTPLKATLQAANSIVVMENVIEVIEKGFGWQP